MKASILISWFLSREFKKLGETVASHPSYFIIIPVFATLVLCTGTQRLKFNTNAEYLVAPSGGKHIEEKERLNILFPKQKDADYFPGRELIKPHLSVVLITPLGGKSVFKDIVFKEILLIDKLVRNITVEAADRQLRYEDLCEKAYGRCIDNDVLALADKIEDIKAGNYSIKYPLSLTRDSFKFYGHSLGGIDLDEDNNVLNAEAVKLFYILEGDTNWKETLASRWELKFIDAIESLNLESIIVDGFIPSSFDVELKNLFPRIFSMYPFSIIGITVFSAVTCLSMDWVHSKPWTGVIAMMSTGLAMGSGFGLVIYCDVPFIVGIVAVPFLLLGVGMDDTFVLLAAWRRTDPKKSVIERMGEAYEESSMAITITSMTNFIAFVSGTPSNFPAVRIFSIYASVSIVFAYIYQLTVVGALMAIYGHAEKQHRHALTFQRISKESSDPHSKSLTRFLPRIILNSDVWGHIGDTLTKWPIKCIGFVIMLSYLSIGFWGITKVKFVGDYKDVSSFDSRLVDFLDKNSKYFHRYVSDVQIVIDEELNYADPSVQTQIEQLFSKIEDNKDMVDSSVTESWLLYYLKFLKDERMESIVKSYNVTDTKDFIELLRRGFLRVPAARRFQQDIVFNQDYTSITASRFVCRMNGKSIEDLVNVMSHLRDVSSKSHFSVFTFNYFNFMVDQAEIQGTETVQIMCAVTAGILVVCLLALPDIIAVLCVTCTVVSIEVCVLGYMSLWNVSVGPVTMILLVLCSGFAVDYSSHFVNCYVRIEILDPNQRLRTAFSRVGLPIFQGSATTFIAALPLIYPIAYSFSASFKIIFLFTLFSVIHALLFLPIALSTIHLFLTGGRKSSLSLKETGGTEFSVKGEINGSFVQNTP